jgi:glycine cleavage system regulatory protein
LAALVLTVIGWDRPGIVEAISGVLSRHEANWEGSRMAHWAGRFAGILLVTVPPDRTADLTQALAKLPGLKVVIDAAEARPSVASERPVKEAILELVGNDRPGIVRELSALLSQRGVNVEELSTECEAAPMGGGSLFRMTATLGLPKNVSVSELRQAVEDLADDLMVDVNVEETE